MGRHAHARSRGASVTAGGSAHPGPGLRRRQALTSLAVVGTAVLALLAGSGAAQAASSDLSQVADSTYQTNGRVNTILPIGDTIYIGGRFTSVRPAGGGASVARNHLAAFDRVSGALLSWNPNADKEVLSLTASLDGTAIYVGGAFAKLGGASRLRLGEVAADTGAVLPWAPRSDQQVNTIAVTPGLIYIGGTFDEVNGVARSRLAAVDANGVLDGTWQPQADDRVRIIVPSPDGQSLFLGGDFLSINGDTAQKILVRLSPVDGSPLPWKFHPGYPVHGIVFTDTTLLAAGDGSGGHIGAFDLTTGARIWTLQTDGGVQAISLMDGVVYGGGHFDNVCVGVVDGATTGFKCPTNLATRHKLVAIDAATGTLDPWNPGANSPLGVFAVANDGGSLQVGGDFTKIGTPNSNHNPTVNQQGYAQFSPTP
jgi:trimeric autotransporter adhesin